jgi:hypothetical protein
LRVVPPAAACTIAETVLKNASACDPEKPMRPLEFGWYLPTHGDTTAYGLAEAQVAGSPELCERVVRAAEQAGFEYLLIPLARPAGRPGSPAPSWRRAPKPSSR